MAIHALHIGLNYRGTPNELYGCVNDAHDWAKRLKPVVEESGGTQIVLTERKAARDGILKAAAKIIERCEPGDELFFTNSSHGTTDTDYSGDEWSGEDQAMVCWGFELIFDDETAGILAARPPNVPAFLLFDSCFSGSPQRGLVQPRFVPYRKCQKHQRDKTGLTTRSINNCLSFSGCEDGPGSYCYDAEFGGRPNGAFTRYALNALDELPPGSSYRRWFTRINRYLPSAEYPQTPTIHGGKRLRSRKVPFV